MCSKREVRLGSVALDVADAEGQKRHSIGHSARRESDSTSVSYKASGIFTMRHLVRPQDRVLLVHDRRLGRLGSYLNDGLKRGFGSRGVGAAGYHLGVSSLRLKLRVCIHRP